MTKKSIQIANATLFGAITIMSVAFTSCSDDKDDLTTSTTEQTSVFNKLSDCYYYSNDTDGSLTIKLNGNDVLVSRNGSVSNTANGKLVYDDNSSGTLEMIDSTFSTKKIPFVFAADMIRLDFNGTGEFSGNSIFLEKNMFTRGSEQDVIPDILSNKDGQNLLLKTTRTILDKGIKTVFGDLGADLAKPLVDLIYPSEASSENEDSQNLKKIESNFKNMESHILKLESMIRKNNLKSEYKEHWDKLFMLRKNIIQTKDRIRKNSDNEAEKVKALNNFAECTIDKNTCSLQLLNTMNEYCHKLVATDKSLFETLDEFLVTSYPFLSQSTGERLLYRTEDLETLTEATELMVAYCRIHNMEYTIDDYKEALTELYEYFNDYSEFDEHENEIVCTIDGAYCVMEKKIGVKKFGKKEFEKANCCFHDFAWGNMCDKEWAYSYVFSNEGAKNEKTELKTMCLTPEEAKAIKNCYDLKLYQILTDKAGMSDLDDNNAVMLLSDWAYPDVNYTLSNMQCKVMARVWENENSTYNGNYMVDFIECESPTKPATHKTDSWAYYTKVTKRFTGDNAYDEFIKFVNTPKNEISEGFVPLPFKTVKQDISEINEKAKNFLNQNKKTSDSSK